MAASGKKSRLKLKDLVISESELLKQISGGDVASVYLFFGPETNLKERALQTLREALLPAGLEMLNETVLDDATARQVIDAAETLPVMCDRRLVIVRDWAPFYAGKAKNEEADVAAVEEWLTHAPETGTVVFYLREDPEEKKKAVSVLMDAKGAGNAVLVYFDHLQGRAMLRWMEAYLKPYHKQISYDACLLMTSMAGSELNRLSGELNKLIAYTDQREEITEQDVSTIVTATLDFEVYELLGIMLSGDLKSSEEKMHKLLREGSRASELIGLLTKQLRERMFVKDAMAKGNDIGTVSKWLGFKNEYRGKAIVRECRRIPAETLDGFFRAAMNAEVRNKSGQIRDIDALDELVTKIATGQCGHSSK